MQQDPEVQTTPAPARTRKLVLFGVCLGLFLLSLGLNHWRGATTSDFGAHDDEAAHVVTGLMVHDYLTSFSPADPMAFAKGFYFHYPKVAIGHWPPVFYTLQTVWSLPFGFSKLSLLALMSLLSGLTGLLVFTTLRSRGLIFAAAGAILFLLTPLVQVFGAAIMTEPPLALFCFAASLQFGKFLDLGRGRNCIGFALLATLGIMTKGNALALALVPAIAIPVTGRWSSLKDKWLWIAAGLVAVLCAPWYWYTLPISSTTWSQGSSPSFEYFTNAVPFYLTTLVDLGGVGVALLAVLGMLSTLTGSARQDRGTWATIFALLLSVVLMHSIVPSSMETRHMVLATPAWIAFALAGAHALWRWIVMWRSSESPAVLRGAAAAVLAALALSFGLERFELPRKDFHGFDKATESILADARMKDRALLIASDAPGEGMFVSCIAIADRRPGHVVLRADKILARGDWIGRNYAPLFHTRRELLAFLDDAAVSVVAIDESMPARRWRAHHELLRETMNGCGQTWKPLARFDVQRKGQLHAGALRLFVHANLEKIPRRTPLTFRDALGDRRLRPKQPK